MLNHKINDFLASIKSDKNLNEWYLSDFVEKNVKILSAEEAFNASEDISKIIFKEKDSDVIYELLYILYYLKQQSETNQIPLWIKNNIDFFDKIKKHHQKDYIDNIINNLCMFYKIK